VIVQWFERARFEYHPANADPYKVLLGRLGAELNGEPPPLPRPALRLWPQAAVAQGRTLQVDVQIEGANAVSGALGSAPLTFIRQLAGWRALGAVSALEHPGSIALYVEAALPDGRSTVATAAVTVLDAGYAVERIHLPPAVQESLDNNQEALAAERARVRAIWPVVTPQKLWAGRFAWPAQGRITSGFGIGRAYNDGPVDSYHEGVDIKNSAGTPIVAPARGQVVLAESGFVARGGAVILDHGWGVHSGYWHMEEVLAREGQFVEPGDVIGRMGARGMATGPHLHWEIHLGATSVDPMEWVEREWAGD
jgi:murein DD-endopeptidase MepM/ murein hydrolase activator NlpD